MTIVHLGSKDFLTSDLHIGGAPWPYKLWFSKNKDVPAVDQLRSSVARSWDYQVSSDSTVVIIGDALDLRAEVVERELAWFNQRPGRKILIPGNHDEPHPMHRLSQDQVEASGWTEVFEIFDARRSYVGIGDHILPACHYPFSETRQAYWRHEKASEYLPVLHGHTHARKAVSRRADGLLQLNVGWPAWKKLASVPAVLEELEQPWMVPVHS